MAVKYWIGGAVAAAMAVAAPVIAGQATGAKAGNFRLNDASGKVVELAQFKGKTVVLEWNNPDCPFVGKHYKSGNMQKQQADATAAGIVWLTINSSATGKQGDIDGAGANAYVAKVGGRQTAYLLDPQGVAGRAYGARTTPHMYVINPEGKLVYAGAIDNKPTARKDDVKTATNYVTAALDEAMAGKPVTKATSEPYGCSVKY